jgi:TM2 domain-containing membrane protein YozV
MKQILSLVPDASGEEAIALQKLTAGFSEEEIVDFALLYREKRRDSQTILLTTLLGFVVVAGVQRFLIGQIGMGILYLFTGGLCLIGTIIDLVNHQKLASAYNIKQAKEIAYRVAR